MSLLEIAKLPTAENSAIHLHAMDNVAIARVPLAAGQDLKVGGSKDPPLHLRLTVPGTVEEPRGGWTLIAEGPMYRQTAGAPVADQVVVDAGDLGSGLIVRQRLPGDRLHPLGAPGRKKVQDVFVDRKVPRDERDRVPIVTDEMGNIVWVAGEVLAAPFRVTPLTTTVVVLTLRRE